MHFWEPAKPTSIPQASHGSGRPPREDTASQRTHAPWSLATFATSRIGFVIPVDVSLWTMTTLLTPRRATRSTSWRSGDSPQLPRITSTSRWCAFSISAHRAPKNPLSTTATLSPRRRRVNAIVSKARWDGPAIGYTSPSFAWKRRFSMSMTSAYRRTHRSP